MQINSPAGERIIDQIVGNPAGTLIGLDFDGTLSPIVDDPTQAFIHSDSRSALVRLQSKLGTLAIVTGRPVAVVRELANFDDELNRVEVFGQYGAEKWDAATQSVIAPEVGEQILEAHRLVQQAIDECVEQGHDLAGVHLEDKGLALGIHTRRANDPTGALLVLTPHATRLADDLGLVVEPGRNVLELRTSSHTKGDVISALVEETLPGVIVFIGDDLGDVAAFEALEDLGRKGLAVATIASASPEQPALANRADIVVEGPDGVAQWLTELADKLDAR